MKIAIVVGEYSGDNVAASLVKSLLQHFPQAEFYGVTGPKLRELKIHSVAYMEDICALGITEVIKHLPKILKVRQQLKHYLQQHPPDMYIGIDAPDFNLPVEKYLKKNLAVLTIHYCSPTVWAWRKRRIYNIAKAVDLLLCLFPFEPYYYQTLPIKAQFVGHPLIDEIAQIDKNQQKAKKLFNLPLHEHIKIIALLPGSRNVEINNLAELFLQVAQRCWEKNKQLKFILPAINNDIAEQLRLLVKKINPDLPVGIHVQMSREMIIASDVVLLASGTATLEAMLLGRPMVVAYKLSRLSYAIARYLVNTPYIALPNIMAKEALVPEFIQERATIENLTKALDNYLENDTTNLIQKFQMIAQQFPKDSMNQVMLTIKDTMIAHLKKSTI